VPECQVGIQGMQNARRIAHVLNVKDKWIIG